MGAHHGVRGKCNRSSWGGRCASKPGPIPARPVPVRPRLRGAFEVPGSPRKFGPVGVASWRLGGWGGILHTSEHHPLHRRNPPMRPLEARLPQGLDTGAWYVTFPGPRGDGLPQGSCHAEARRLRPHASAGVGEPCGQGESPAFAESPWRMVIACLPFNGRSPSSMNKKSSRAAVGRRARIVVGERKTTRSLRPFPLRTSRLRS